jgi:3-phosphoshikimate 1-carboxyvinyltransferase
MENLLVTEPSTSVAEPVEAAGVREIRRVKKLRGSLSFPGDAHQAMLACGLAALGEEPARITNLPDAPWFSEYRAALESMGVRFGDEEGGETRVWGGALRSPGVPLELRHELAALIVAGICSGKKLDATLRLDPSLVPADTTTLLKALWPQTGTVGEDEVRIGELNPKARTLVKPFERKWDDGMTKVALLFHHLAAGEALELHVRRQGSDLLENLLRHFGVDLKVERDDDKEADELTRRMARQLRAAGKEIPVTRIKLPSSARIVPAPLTLAGDATAASVAALAATLARGSDVLLENVLLNAGRGGFLAALRRMGADIEVTQRREPRQGGGEANGALRVRHSEIFAKRFDGDSIADMRDEIFMLVAAAACAEGESIFRDIAWLRSGPVDRLKECVAALKRTGVEAGEIEDGIVVRGRAESDGAAWDALGHPGLAAAWAVLALKSHGSSTLADGGALEARHPGLVARIETLGGTAPAENTP